MNAATVGGRRRAVTLLVDVRTLAHNAIAQTWRPIPRPTPRPRRSPPRARLLAVTGNIRRHLDDLEGAAHAALEGNRIRARAVSTGATLQPSTSTGAPA